MRESFPSEIPILTRLTEYFVENVHGNVKQGGGGSRDKHPTSLGYLHRLIAGLLREVDECVLGYHAPPLKRSSGSFADSWKPSMMICKCPKRICVCGSALSGEACSCIFSNACASMETVPHQDVFEEIARMALIKAKVQTADLNPNMSGLKHPDDALNALGSFSLLGESDEEDEQEEEEEEGHEVLSGEETESQIEENTADFYERINDIITI
jgi:hypothetical protein